MKPLKLVYLFIGVVFCGWVLSWATQVGSQEHLKFESAIVQSLEQVPPISVPGTVNRIGVVPLYALEDGIVTEIFVQSGEIVKKGQVLATLDVTEEELKLASEMQALKTPQRNQRLARALESVDQLEKKGFYNGIEAEEARSQVLRLSQDWIRQQATLSDLKRKTEGKVLRSPMDGVVSQISWKKGDLVTVSRQLNPGVTVAPFEKDFRVQLEIPDDAISQVRMGSRVSVRAPGSESQVVGTLISISSTPVLMEKTRYYVGVANLAGGAGLEDGVRLMGEIELTRDDQVVWIPREAFDIDLPPSMVNETVSYLKQPAIERSRTLAADELSGKGTLAHKQENGVQSTASRSIASDVSPNDSEQSDVFLLTPDDKVLRAIVARGPGNDRYVQVRAKELSGARVITNFRYERGSLRRLLGAGR